MHNRPLRVIIISRNILSRDSSPLAGRVIKQEKERKKESEGGIEELILGRIGWNYERVAGLWEAWKIGWRRL